MAERQQRDSKRFPATQWSLVDRAGQPDPEAKREALEELLRRYLPALQAYLVRQKRLPEEKADDVLQEFIASKILRRDLVGRADRERGKFRTLLLTALDRFVKNRLRDEHAQKRVAGDGAVALHDEQGELAQRQQPSAAFDVAWARSVIDDALRNMRRECEDSDRMQLWGIFESRVVGPTLEGAKPVDYAELVDRFGFQSPSQASNALTTAKRMYARALRSAVQQYAQDEAEVESEINDLRGILARGGA